MSSDWRLVTAPGKTIANTLLNCSRRSDTSSSSSLPASTCATRRTRTSGAGLDDGEEEGGGVPIVAGEDVDRRRPRAATSSPWAPALRPAQLFDETSLVRLAGSRARSERTGSAWAGDLSRPSNPERSRGARATPQRARGRSGSPEPSREQPHANRTALERRPRSVDPRGAFRAAPVVPVIRSKRSPRQHPHERLRIRAKPRDDVGRRRRDGSVPE